MIHTKPVPKVKKKKPRKKTNVMKQADELFSTYWRTKIGKCERCGRSDSRLELAHFKSRDYKTVRYERKNTFVLCGGINIRNCHVWAHCNPDLFKDFYIEQRGQEDLNWVNNQIRNLEPLGTEFYQAYVDEYKEKLRVLTDL